MMQYPNKGPQKFVANTNHSFVNNQSLVIGLVGPLEDYSFFQLEGCSANYQSKTISRSSYQLTIYTSSKVSNNMFVN